MDRYQRYQLLDLPTEMNNIVEKYHTPNQFHIKHNYTIKDIYSRCAISMFGSHDYLQKHIRRFFYKRFIMPTGDPIYQMIPRAKPHEVDLIYIGKPIEEYYYRDGYGYTEKKDLKGMFKDKKLSELFKILKYCILNS